MEAPASHMEPDILASSNAAAACPPLAAAAGDRDRLVKK